MIMQKIRESVEEGRLMRYLGEKGQGIVEYALILAFVVAVAAAIASGGNLKTAIDEVFTKVTNQVSGKSTGTSSTTPTVGQ